MYHILGHFVRRAWPFLLVGWALLLVGARWAAPPWDQVAQDKEFGLLPLDAPSRQAEEVFARAFPEDRRGSSIVLILFHTDNDRRQLARDQKFIEDVIEPRLRKIAEEAGGLASQPEVSDEPLFSDESEPPAK